MERRAFNNPKVISRGWYWALPSKELPKGSVKAVKHLGREVLLFRGESGQVFAMDPYCPHMGAHLGQGKVVGDGLHCGFHGWRYNGQGQCVGYPAASQFPPKQLPPPKSTYTVGEKFAMIWLHSEREAQDPLPEFPLLAGKKYFAFTDTVETRFCHPTLILGGGVDEDHFLAVHEETTNMTGPLRFSHERVSPTVIRFENTAKMAEQSVQQRFLSRLYGGVLRYRVTYWYASTALAELGFPWLPLYSIFAYRPTPEGHTEGLNIYVTPYGGLLGRFAVALTRSVLRKGGGEDTPIQNTMRFRETPWVREAKSFAAFIDYVNEQPTREYQEPSA